MDKINAIEIKGALYPVYYVNIHGIEYMQVKLPIGYYKNGRKKNKVCSALTKEKLVKKVIFALSQTVISEEIPNFEQLCNFWLKNEKFLTVSPATYDKVESVIQSHFIPDLGNLRVNQIDDSLLQNYINELAKKGNKKTGKGLGFETVKKILSVLSELLDYSVRKGYISTNYTKYVKIPKYAKKPREKRFLDDESLIKFMNELNRKDSNGKFVYYYRNAIRFALLTGLRTCELFGLKKDMINFDKNCFYVQRDSIRVRNRNDNGESVGGYTTYCADNTKNNSSMRSFPLTNEIKEILIEQLDGNDSEYVFPNKDGNIIKASTFSQRFKKICDNAGVDITPYSLRHTFATNAIYDTELSIFTVSRLMGHSSSKVTEEVYIHSIQSKEQELSNSLSKIYREKV